MLFRWDFGEWPLLSKLWFVRPDTMATTDYYVCVASELEDILHRFLGPEDEVIIIREIQRGIVITKSNGSRIFLSDTITAVEHLLDNIDETLEIGDRSTVDLNYDLGDIPDDIPIVELT